VTYIFASNVPELVPFLALVFFRIPLALTVMQILAVTSEPISSLPSRSALSRRRTT
jgi:hypothetical protein